MTREEIIRGLRACSHQQPECRDKCPLWISSDSDGFCHRGERKENA